MPNGRHLPLLVVLASASLAYAQTPPATLTLKTTSRTETLSAADLADLPHVTVRMSIHDAPHVFEGVRISRLLARIGVATGDSLRGNALANAVLVHSRDGYEVVLALAETDPAFNAEPPILADRMDGKPIGDEEGPFRLIVQGELKPARSARMVDRIEVRPLGSR